MVSNMKTAASIVAWIWIVYILNWIMPIDFENWGLVPRSWWGLVGIFTSPFLHASLGHIISNTIPLFVLIILLSASDLRAVEIIGSLIFVGGILLWIGASGLIYGWAAYIVVAGFVQGRFLALLIGLVTIFLYGGLVWGVLPTQTGVSWDGHLFGAIGGVALAFALKPDSPTTKEHRPNFLKEDFTTE